MKTVLLGLAALVILLVAAVIVAPSFIDWTRYRDSVAGEIEQALGRRVTIEGAVEAALVPTPRLSLKDVRLGNLPGAAAPDMAQAEALEIRVALWPLLSGQIVVESVVLRKPVIALEILADGRRNWQFTPDDGENGFADARFENVAVSDGTITYRDGRSGREDKVEGVNGRFATDSFQGPLRASAEFHYRSIPLRMSLSTGRFDPDGRVATPFNLMAELPAPPRGLGLGLDRAAPARGSGSLIGSMRLTDDGPQMGGQLKLNGEDFAGFLAALGGGALPPLFAQRFSLDGAVDYRDGTLDAKTLALQLGETRGQGTLLVIATAGKPRVDLDIGIGRIDLDAWLAAAKPPKGGEAASPAAGSDEFVIPDGVDLTLNATADALTYSGGAVRQLKLVAELADGAAEIHRFSAQLPGATDASFNGKLIAAAGKPRLDGLADIASDDFRGLLAWLDVDISDMPAGRLNKVSALAQVGLTAESLEIGDLDARFDTTRVTGALTTLLRDRPAIGANLIVDRIDLDSYLGPETLSASLLADFDANLRLQVGQLTARQITVGDLSLDGTLVNGELTMRKLAFGDLAGARGSLSGTLAGLTGKPRMAVDFDVAARQPSGLLALGGIVLPFASSALEPFSASGKLSGGAGRYALDTTMAAGDLAVALTGDIRPSADATRSAFDITLAHPDYVQFLRLMESGFVPQRAAQASDIHLAAHVEGGGTAYTLSSLRGNFGPLALDGRASLALDGGLPRLEANLTAGDIDTGNFLSRATDGGGAAAAKAGRWSGEPIDLDLASILGGHLALDAKSLRHGKWTVGAPKIDLTMGSGGVELTKLTGQLMGGQLSAQGRLMSSGRSDAALALDYSFNLTGAQPGSSLFGGTPIDISGGRFDLAAEGAAVGTSEAALLAAMTGKGSVTLRNATLKGFDLGQLNDGFATLKSVDDLARLSRSAMSGGSTRIASARGGLGINDGVLSMDDLRIESPAGKASVLLAADLLRWRVDATAEITLADQPAAPPLEVQLSGRLEAPERDIRSDPLQGYLRAALATRDQRRPAQPRPAPQPAPEPSYQAPPYQAPPYQAPSYQAPPYQAPSYQPPSSSPTPMSEAPAPASPPQSAVPQASGPSVQGSAPQTVVPQGPTVPRVLSVSPNAPASLALPESGAASAPPQEPAPLGRVLRVSPNASPSAVPAQPSGPAPRTLSVSPNAGKPDSGPTADAAAPQSQFAPTQLVPGQSNSGASPAQPQSTPQSEIDSFTRDVLRGLEQ